jgi:ABC-type antimicrobial peptide transport system permease subunit
VVVIGAVVGALLAVAAGRLIASLLYGVEPRDPLALATVAGVLVLVAVMAAVIPAWRASRTDPLEAFRAD